MRTQLTILLALLTGLSAWAQENSLHLPDGKRVSFNWDVKDGLDSRWGIDPYGRVVSGTNNPYSSGMRLTLTDGNEFSANGNRMSEGGREIEIGPWQYGNVQVWRRIYVDDKQGYCRWIDIFENNSGEPFRVSLCYRNGMSSSVNEVLSVRGAKTVEAKDWAFATMFRESSNRPVVVHVIASPTAKTKPRVQWKAGSNEVQYFQDLTVEPNKPVALVFFHSQQPNVAKARAFMKAFDMPAELAKVPAPLRAILANASAAAAVGSMEKLNIPRDAKDDLAVLRNGDQIRGTITTDTFVVKTIFGEMKIPAARVTGVSLPQDEDAYAQLLLTDGQILAGDLTSPVVVKLSEGNDVKLSPRDVRSAAYRISDDKPAEIAVAASHLVLRNGQRLYLADMPTLEFGTLHGRLKLGEEQVSRIVMDTPEGGLHRAMFRNGSVLSGLLTAEKLSAKLTLGATLNVSINMVSRIEFGGEDAGAKAPPAQVTLRNDDTLLGTPAAAELDLLTDSGSKQSVRLADIASMEFDPESMEKVALTLKSGTTMSGKLRSRSLTFKLGDGPEMELFLGHVSAVTINVVEEESADEGAEGDAGAADTPATVPADDAAMEKARARVEVLAAEVDTAHRALAEANKDWAERQRALAAAKDRRAALGAVEAPEADAAVDAADRACAAAKETLLAAQERQAAAQKALEAEVAAMKNMAKKSETVAGLNPSPGPPPAPSTATVPGTVEVRTAIERPATPQPPQAVPVIR